MDFDIIIIGSGPGGYVAAIRASQLGHKTAIIEKESLGGVCLNWGCIPTKALLKSAQVFDYIEKSEEYGINVGEYSANFEKMIKRSRNISNGMSKGINFLMKKNKITVIKGHASIVDMNKIKISDENSNEKTINGKHIIIATGAKSRNLKNIPQDGINIIGYRDALVLRDKPKNLTIVGSGAIGVEMAYFFNKIGTKVTLIEYLPNIIPNEDKDVSVQLERIFKKSGINVLTNTSVERVKINENSCELHLNSNNKAQILNSDKVLSAIGIEANIKNIGLENIGIATDNGKIIVDEFYQCNIPGFYAIGDVISGPALAHVASAEGILCVEKISGIDVKPIDMQNIPSCTYCSPEIASVGLTEKKAIDLGYKIKVGKFPFSASGKASASGHKDGFVKVIFDEKYGELLGCHMIGTNVTDMIAEAVVARKLETTGHEILKTVHPHPTMSEAVMEAVADAYDEVIHL